MSTQPTTAESIEAIRHRYRDNFSRHLLGLARYLQKNMMQTLSADYGHANLRLGYAPYITLLANSDTRLTDLAQALGISRQACNQAVKQIEKAGYIGSKEDPEDGRARLLTLTTRGQQLRDDGARTAYQLDKRFLQMIGKQPFEDAARSLRKLHRELALELATPGSNIEQLPTTVLGGLLPRLSDYVIQRLMDLTIARGHPGLKLSFVQVLLLIGPNGGRIQHMASVHDVSKQAISVIATELEELGYIERRVDPEDARQIVLYFTEDGRHLIADSVKSLAVMEDEFRDIVGCAAFGRLTDVFRELYQGLQIDREHTHKASPEQIQALASKLQRKLGRQGSRELARLLLADS